MDTDEFTSEVLRFTRSQRKIQLDCGLTVRTRVSGGRKVIHPDGDDVTVRLDSAACEGDIQLAHIVRIDDIPAPWA